MCSSDLRPFGVLWGFFIAIPIADDIDLMDDLYLLRDAATETLVVENFVRAVVKPALNSALISAFCDPRESEGVTGYCFFRSFLSAAREGNPLRTKRGPGSSYVNSRAAPCLMYSLTGFPVEDVEET